MTAKQKDIILGLFIVIVFSFVYLYIIPREVPVLSPVRIAALSPDFWPRNITLLIIFLGAFQVVYALARPYPQQKISARTREENIKDLLLALLLVAYCLVVSTLGILLSSVLCMRACMLIFGERRPIMLILFAILLPLGMHMFLVKVAKILIPSGILPF